MLAFTQHNMRMAARGLRAYATFYDDPEFPDERLTPNQVSMLVGAAALIEGYLATERVEYLRVTDDRGNVAHLAWDDSLTHDMVEGSLPGDIVSSERIGG